MGPCYSLPVLEEANVQHTVPHCPKCGAEVCELPELEPRVESRIRELARSGNRFGMTMAELREATGWEYEKCKAWVIHQDQPCPPTRTAPCPYCAMPLRTEYAKQCRHCKKDWHDENNVRMLGSD